MKKTMHFNLFRRNHTPLYNPPPGPPPPQVYAPPPGPPPFMPPHGPPPTMAVTDLSPPEYSNSDSADDEYGALSDAEVGDFDAAELFCGEIYPVYRAKGLADYPFDLITQQGPKMWKMTPPESLGYDILRNYSTIERPEWAEVGSINRGINIETKDDCPCFCLLSNLPVVGGALPTGGNRGVYYEISNIIMGGDPGYSIAVGMACKPYPSWRFPGWNRLGAALHLDDYHTFYESPKGGLPLPERYHLPGPGVRPKITDTFGCGVDFQNRSLFFTYNGTRIDAPYRVVYPAAIPSDNSALGTDVVQGRYDVFAAIGVQGKSQFEVNFGSKAFAWREGNRPEWRLENHISNGEPPRYAEI